MKILASEQVQLWIAGLPPAPKQKVRAALKNLAGSGKNLDIKALRQELEGFYRLRIGNYRLIYHLQPNQTICLDYADLRDEVYEAFRRLRALQEMQGEQEDT